MSISEHVPEPELYMCNIWYYNSLNMLYPTINSNSWCSLDTMLWEVLKTSRTAFVQENARAFLVFRRASVLGLPGASDVVYLQDHLDYLSSEQDLLLLANQGLDHMLLLHVIGVFV